MTDISQQHGATPQQPKTFSPNYLAGLLLHRNKLGGHRELWLSSSYGDKQDLLKGGKGMPRLRSATKGKGKRGFDSTLN